MKKTPLVVAGFLSQLLTTESQAEQISKHLDALNTQIEKKSLLLNKISKVKNSSHGRVSKISSTLHLKSPYIKFR